MYHCIFLGEICAWVFIAPTLKSRRKIVNTILAFEQIGCGNDIRVYSRNRSESWVAKRFKFEEIKQILGVGTLEELKSKAKEVIEIKRKRPLKIDVIYLTRPQKERWTEEQ